MSSNMTIFTKRATDCSTLSTFQYIFYCDQCGKPWKSKPVKYKKDPSILENQSYAWNRAYEEALKTAMMRGMLYFNQCRKCHRWVCHEHYDFQEQQCSECSKKGD